MGPQKHPYGAKTKAICDLIAKKPTLENSQVAAILKPTFGSISLDTITKARAKCARVPKKAGTTPANFVAYTNGHAGDRLSHVKAAKEFVRACGSRENAESALDELANLME